MLAKKVVAHTTCEQIRSRDVLGEKPCRAWSSRQPDSSNVVTLSVFGKNRHKNNIRMALVAVGSSHPPPASAIPAVWSQRLLDEPPSMLVTCNRNATRAREPSTTKGGREVVRQQR